ncbi:MAG: glutathione S-transferase family protein, partial [Gemmatimonadetes bacterium]|nr:glutathione S-transferase family protein [Gemmatimonadota bacterium]
MGLLIDGQWHGQPQEARSTKGRFVRRDAQFRNWITPDGSPGPSGEGGFEAKPGRFHLYVSYACPWAHRTLIFRVLKGLEEMISISVVHWHMGESGWTFNEAEIPDSINHADYAYQIYTA